MRWCRSIGESTGRPTSFGSQILLCWHSCPRFGWRMRCSSACWPSQLCSLKRVHPRIIIFPHRPAASASLVAAQTRLRSPRFSLADNCRADGPAALLSGEQCKGECEPGLWFRRKSAADSACAIVCDSSNAVVPARCLSANAPSFRQNFSSRRIVKAMRRMLRRDRPSQPRFFDQVYDSR